MARAALILLVLLCRNAVASEPFENWLILTVPSSVVPDDPAFESNLRPAPGQPTLLAAHAYLWRSPGVPAALDPAPSYTIFAWSEIEIASPKRLILATSSDAPFAVRLNGAEVAAKPYVPVELRSGRNSILLRTSKPNANWTFGARLMTPAELTGMMISDALSSANPQRIREVLDSGLVDVNQRDESGLSTLRAAEIKGYSGLATFLRSRGAVDDEKAPAADRLLDAEIRRMVGPTAPGAAILVGQRGRVLFRAAYGLADVERGVPMTPPTVFRIGSITKQFTAAAVLRLVDEGKIRTSDPVSRYVPDFPGGAGITVAQLLHHTSGIPNYTEKPGFMATVSRHATLREMVRYFQDDPRDFPPGSEWYYSNSNYVLLAYIIEQVTGMPYGQFLRRRILGPLKLQDTGVSQSFDIPRGAAKGYQWMDGKFTPAAAWDMSRATGALSMYSNVDDLFRWTEALMQGRVVSKASLQEALTPARFEGDDWDGGYGYGVMLSRFRGQRTVQHGGTLHGFNCYLLHLPDEGLTVVVLTNSLPGRGLDPGRLARDAVEFFLSGTLPARPERRAVSSIDPGLVRAVTGRYAFRPLPVTLAPKPDGKLYLYSAAGPEVELIPVSDTEFAGADSDLRIRIVQDAAGKVIQAIEYQDGTRLTGRRL